MRYHCHDPFSAISRVIDIARRLDLPFSRLCYDRTETGFVLSVELTDTACHAAQVFAARLEQLIDLEPVRCDA